MNRPKVLGSCGVIALFALAVIIGPVAHGVHAGGWLLPLALPSSTPTGACSHWSALAAPNPGTSGNALAAITAVPGSSQFWAVGYAFDTTSNLQHTLIERYDGVN